MNGGSSWSAPCPLDAGREASESREKYGLGLEVTRVAVDLCCLVKTVHEVSFDPETSRVHQPITVLLQEGLIVEVSRRPLRQAVPPTHCDLFDQFFLRIHLLLFYPLSRPLSPPDPHVLTVLFPVVSGLRFFFALLGLPLDLLLGARSRLFLF